MLDYISRESYTIMSTSKVKQGFYAGRCGIPSVTIMKVRETVFMCGVSWICKKNSGVGSDCGVLRETLRKEGKKKRNVCSLSEKEFTVKLST
jgi:hypothetical protein